MFNHATAGQPLPIRLSTDHDLLFRFHRWLANLRVLEIRIGTGVKSCFLPRQKARLDPLMLYASQHRVHRSLDGTTPAQSAGASSPAPASLDHHAWRQHCHGLFQTPIAA